MSKVKTGKFGESLAADFLKTKGYEILERNYRFGHGEIDLIAKDKESIVFVEVKYRKSLKYGYPENAISKRKIAQVKKIAEAYLHENEIYDVECRIDVITILKNSAGKLIFNHYENISMI